MSSISQLVFPLDVFGPLLHFNFCFRKIKEMEGFPRKNFSRPVFVLSFLKCYERNRGCHQLFKKLTFFVFNLLLKKIIYLCESFRIVLDDVCASLHKMMNQLGISKVDITVCYLKQICVFKSVLAIIIKIPYQMIDEPLFKELLKLLTKAPSTLLVKDLVFEVIMVVHVDVQLNGVILHINFHLTVESLEKLKSLSELCLNHDVKRYASENSNANLDKPQMLDSFLLIRFETARDLGEKSGAFVIFILETFALGVQKLHEIRNFKIFPIFKSCGEILRNYDTFMTFEFACSTRIFVPFRRLVYFAQIVILQILIVIIDQAYLKLILQDKVVTLTIDFEMIQFEGDVETHGRRVRICS